MENEEDLGFTVLTPRSKKRQGASHWFHVLGALVHAYATIASPHELLAPVPCVLGGTHEGRQYKLEFCKYELVHWFHEREQVSSSDLFGWLCENATVSAAHMPQHASDDWVAGRVVPGRTMTFLGMTAFLEEEEDDSMQVDDEEDEREEEEEEEEVFSSLKQVRQRLLMCTACHRQAPQPGQMLCVSCRLMFAQRNMTPPGKIKVKHGEIRKLCAVCEERPARKSGRLCESCSYRNNKTACKRCGLSGRKIVKGLCPVCR